MNTAMQIIVVILGATITTILDFKGSKSSMTHYLLGFTVAMIVCAIKG